MFRIAIDFNDIKRQKSRKKSKKNYLFSYFYMLTFADVVQKLSIEQHNLK